jgi:hypothetical protein
MPTLNKVMGMAKRKASRKKAAKVAEEVPKGSKTEFKLAVAILIFGTATAFSAIYKLGNITILLEGRVRYPNPSRRTSSGERLNNLRDKPVLNQMCSGSIVWPSMRACQACNRGSKRTSVRLTVNGVHWKSPPGRHFTLTTEGRLCRTDSIGRAGS